MITGRVLSLISRAKKVDRKQLIQLKDLGAKAGAWNEAITAGQLALQIDPSDSALDTELKDLTAQRAMSQGGYEAAAGKEGGFRELVKDMDKQRELEQDESIAGVGGSEEQVVDRAKTAYLETPTVPDVLNRYAQLLRKSGSDDALQEAHKIYMKGYEDTNEYRFRMNAGDINILQARAACTPLEGEALEAARAACLQLEQSEYSERAERYPTDRMLKFRLGEVSLRIGEIDTAMACFQKSKDEPKIRTRSGHLLGRCFAKEGWHSEAIDEYRDTIANVDATEGELELQIRYDLMESLIELAKQEQSVDHAREALEICSGIARKDITYRDIRSRRKELDELSRELS
jgi:soluble cytochrome b562